jgi:hypothetical protein
MGGTFDYDYTNVDDYHDPIQDVNQTQADEDRIDFNQ